MLFSGEDGAKPTATLSGGEAARLVMCKLILMEYNVLILDEPTDHLDLESISALREAIEAYKGTIFFVTHDRDLATAATRIWSYPDSGELLDYDGQLDATSSFEWGALTQHTLDDDDDGRADGWEEYEQGRMRQRTLDRDRDGTPDAFYLYAGDSLTLERHDGDNDGRIDREIHYRDRQRVRAEEDLDRDGRTDVWYRYGTHDGVEFVTRIERDKQGLGRPDVIETFAARGDESQLTRREEDVDGDGKADIVSIFREGKLVRRELASPDLRPL